MLLPPTILTSVLILRYDELECTAGNVDSLQRLRNRSFDVVITDPATSIEEDLAVTPELKSVRPEIKTIVLAPEASHGDLLDAIRVDASAWFIPSFDYMDIAAMTASALAAETWTRCHSGRLGSGPLAALKVSSHLRTADPVVRFMTELQIIGAGP